MRLLVFFCCISCAIYTQNTFSIQIGDNIHSQSPWSVVEVDDGYLISSYLNNATNFSVNLDIAVSKIDKKGNLLWEKTYVKDTTSEFYPYLKEAENKNEFILVCSYGQTINDSLNVQYVIVKKIDELGEIIWEKYLVGKYVRDFQVAENGDIYVLAGNHYQKSSDSDSTNYNGYVYGNPLIYKLNKDGEILWSKLYGKQFYELFKFINIIDNNIYMGGSLLETAEIEGKYYKLDMKGNIIYEKRIAHSVYSIYKDDNKLQLLTRNDIVYNLLENGNLELLNSEFSLKSSHIRGFTFTSSKEYVVAYNWTSRIGNEPYGVVLLEKYDENFNILWSKEYFKGSDHNNRGVIETSDGGLLLFGFFYPESSIIVSGNAISILKMDCEGNLEWSTDACYVPQITDLTLFPNPFSDVLKIQIPNLSEKDNYNLALYNQLGQQVVNQKINTKITAINTSSLSKALYFYKLINHSTTTAEGKVLKK